MKIEPLFQFIKQREPDIIEILDAKIKDYDDEDGAIGQHYIVKCRMRSETYTPERILLDTGVTYSQERTCLVDKDIYKQWLTKYEAIKWI